MARKKSAIGFAFTQDDVQEGNDTPTVLSEHRSKAWSVYQELGFPSAQDEAWRRTSLSGLDFGGLQLPNGKPLGDSPEKVSGKILSDKVIGSYPLAFLTPQGVEKTIPTSDQMSDLIIESLDTAAAQYPDLVAKILGKVVAPEDGKFAAAAGAFSKVGLFIYVPKGLQVDAPVAAITFSPWARTANFYQILIYLEEGSSLTFMHESVSGDGLKEPLLASENLEIFVGPNANLKVIDLQSYGRNVWSFGHKKAVVERDGNLEWEIGALGSHLSKHFVTIDLVGKGAEGRVAGLFFTDQDQHLSYNTLQRHLAPRTTSDLLFKGALNGNSRSVWRGMIYVAPGAQHIDGYQANRNLILDPDARSDSIPGLEILNNDVRCTHGSTIGKIDQEQLFYLLSRGIPRGEAEILIIQGFFHDIFSRYAVPEVKDRVWDSIEEQLNLP
jgi:Fe-S cluster assembly protein SufD